MRTVDLAARRGAWFWAAALLALQPQAASALGAPRAAAVERSCPAAPKDAAWRCVSVRAADGFPISALIAPARAANPGRKALFVVEGMDESGVAAAADGLVDTLSAVRGDRDIVVVDQRGSGGAEVLTCPVVEPPGGDALSLAHVTACRTAALAKLDLSRVTSQTAASDLEQVRIALGYRRMEILGFFQGARVAQLYATRFPRRVEALALLDPAPPGESMPAAVAQNAPRALDLVTADCLADAACKAAYPNLAAERTAVFARLDKEALRAGPVTIPGDLVAAWLGGLSLRVGTGASVPALIHALALGQDEAVGQRMLASQKAALTAYPLGARLAIECGEDMPAPAPATNGWAARRLLAEVSACALWREPRHARRPRTAQGTARFPVLILSGEAEPTVRLAALGPMARTLPGAHLLVLRGRARAVDTDWDSCVGPMTTSFLAASGRARPDESCVARLKRPPFKLTPLGQP